MRYLRNLRLPSFDKTLIYGGAFGWALVLGYALVTAIR